MKSRFFLSFVLMPLFFFAQDSATTAVLKWDVKSARIADRKYELTFLSSAPNGIQVYTPSQDLDGTKSAELSFNDSSIVVEKFTATGNTEKITSPVEANTKIDISVRNIKWKAIISFKNVVPAQLQGKLSVFFNRGEEVFLSDLPFSFNAALEGGTTSSIKIKSSSIDIKNPVSSCGDEGTQHKGLAAIFLLGLLGGLIAFITPCVFPLVPVTVTFFTKKSQTRQKAIMNAAFYGLFIFLIYVAITIPFHIASNTISPEIFNNISTNVWINLIFFAVFIFFAISFFGFFEIVLPYSIANKADARSGLGNIAGIFFMAGTLAIVSFSCTGPILGTLLANVANEGPWPLTAGAAGFGLALGLPFALFALFPRWLHSLPRSGSWMTDVKVVLGFIELALAVKFFANADNVEQWGILKREIFIGLWIVIGLLIILYLLGWLPIHRNRPAKKFSPARIAFILFFSATTLYLVPGVTNTRWASLGLLSGFPPPLSYSIYKHHVLIAEGIMPLHNDYEAAMQQARAQNKPLLIDFTGWACVNCRRMEEKIWTNKEVDELMRSKFIVVSLYVDEKTKLPSLQQTIFNTSGGQEKHIVTVGDRWATFQSENFNAASQPQYAIINADEIALTKTKFYTPNPKEFAAWLRCGLKAFEERSK